MANGGYVKSVASDPLAMPFLYAVTLGRIPGFSRVIVNGRSSTLTLGADVWEGGVGPYPLLASASKLDFVSTSVLDTILGTGARSFMIQGLDVNFNPISETVNLNGLTPVTTVNAYLRVNRILITGAGSGLVNAGIVTVQVTGGGTIQGVVPVGVGLAKTAVYTVPAGNTLLLTEMEFDIANGGVGNNATYGIARQVPGGQFWIQGEFVSAVTSALERVITTGAKVDATNTVSVRVTGVTGTISGHAAFEGILCDNTQLV